MSRRASGTRCGAYSPPGGEVALNENDDTIDDADQVVSGDRSLESSVLSLVRDRLLVDERNRFRTGLANLLVEQAAMLAGDDAPDRVRKAATINAELSERELQVLKLIANGSDNAAIAGELRISPKTVKNHVSSILAKLEIENRIQAAVCAVRAGIA